jgi:hypothetical protein
VRGVLAAGSGTWQGSWPGASWNCSAELSPTSSPAGLPFLGTKVRLEPVLCPG